jgi:hypothetical protein
MGKFGGVTRSDDPDAAPARPPEEVLLSRSSTDLKGRLIRMRLARTFPMWFRPISSSRDAWLMLIVPIAAACASRFASTLDGFVGFWSLSAPSLLKAL